MRQADQAFERYRASFGIRPPRVFAEDLVRLAAAAGVPEVAEAAARKYGVTEPPGLPPGTRATTQEGELLVIVENGFVAHRTEEKVYVPVLRSERAMIGSGSIDEIVKAAMVIAVRTVFFMNQASREGRRYLRDYEGLLVLGSAALDAELISFAWPAYVLDGNAVDEIVVELAGSDPVDAVPVEDLSAISVRDFEEEKPKVLLRMLARVLLKETAVSRTAAAATKQGGEVVGFLARLGARTAATLTERADVRSWSLLPDEVRIARFTLPPGQHPLSIRVRDAGRGPWRRVDLGTVEIRNRRT
ncbi:MAG: hypothetical protein GTN89_10455, partial [Acidobacteria bacterium]|nr:hypothetical protein [Acidobacteriota bacterium]